jgi:hypothetical protein
MPRRIVVSGLVLVAILVTLVGARGELLAQAPTPPRTDTSDAALAALVVEVRGLRADMAAASRNQLRAQMLMGRVAMQEQRLAYLDKQRSEASAQAAAVAQMTSALRSQVQGFDNGGCNAGQAEQRRDCESMAAMLKRQLAEQDARAQQLRAQESELTNALSAEQARWSDFNARLDELEQSIR